MQEAISRVGIMGSSTNTAAALQAMRTEQFVAHQGDRRNVPNIAILITGERITA